MLLCDDEICTIEFAFNSSNNNNNNNRSNSNSRSNNNNNVDEARTSHNGNVFFFKVLANSKRNFFFASFSFE